MPLIVLWSGKNLKTVGYISVGGGGKGQATGAKNKPFSEGKWKREQRITILEM